MEQVRLEAIEHTRKVDLSVNVKHEKLGAMAEAQIGIIKEQNHVLEQENCNVKEEIKTLNVELETATKSIHDKDRSIK